MNKIISKFFGLGSKRTSGFSSFFRDSSSAEKKKVIKKVIREANKDQRELIERASRLAAQSE